MKSRLAVSILFTLIAATCIPNAMIAVGKLKSRTGEILGCSAVYIRSRMSRAENGSGMSVPQTSSPNRASMNLDSLHVTNPPGGENRNFEFLATANKILEIVDRIHSK